MAFYTSNDSVNAIVADVGSYATKIGFAGEDFPKSYFRSVRVVSFAPYPFVGQRSCCRLSFSPVSLCVYVPVFLSDCLLF